MTSGPPAVLPPVDRRERAALYLKDSPAKRRILEALKKEPWSITDLAQLLDVSVPTAHQHVEELEQLGLVDRERVGRKAYVALTPLGKELAP